MNFLWTTFTRFEPATDIYASHTSVVSNHLSYKPPILIDARLPPGFPTELTTSDDLGNLVNRRWSEYFPSGGVVMGDSEQAHLDPPRSRTR